MQSSVTGNEDAVVRMPTSWWELWSGIFHELSSMPRWFFGGAAAFESPTVLNVTPVNSGLTKLGSGVWFVIFQSFVITSPFLGTADWNPLAASRGG